MHRSPWSSANPFTVSTVGHLRRHVYEGVVHGDGFVEAQILIGDVVPGQMIYELYGMGPCLLRGCCDSITVVWKPPLLTRQSFAHGGYSRKHRYLLPI